MKVKRIYILIILISILFLILLYRLGQIQLLSTQNFGPNHVNLLENSVAQRSHQIVLSNGRGTIIDRNGNPLTNKAMYDVILFPGIDFSNDEAKKMSSLLTIGVEQLKSKTASLEFPTYATELFNIEISEQQYMKLQHAKIQGTYPVERAQMGDPMLAQHFIGIVRNNPNVYKNRYEQLLETETKPVGISGIEQAFDSFLISKKVEKLLYHVDASGEPMFGVELRYSGHDNSFYPLTVQTTLNSDFQSKAEELLNKYGLKQGGIVLLDVHSRDVLAMASRPNVNLKDPYDQNSITNQMLKSNFPGSVFKTVIALAAIEEIKVDSNRTFDCSLDIHGKKKAERNLKTLNFDQSFAQSCNRTFAQLATELVEKDENSIENYAQKLGIIGPVGWTGDIFQYNSFQQFPYEDKGTIWGNESLKEDDNFVRLTAIGQKNVRVTPLAVANMMATIAMNGEKKEVGGVNQILYKNGAVMTEFPVHRIKEDGLNPYSINRLKQLLYLVTEKGTASSLKGLNIAGKSGTAQIDAKKNIHHHWFAGFFPYENPKYAMVVVDLNNVTGKTPIYKIYRELVEYIYSKES